MKKILTIFSNVEIWKVILLFMMCLIILIWSGHTITVNTKWGAIYKGNKVDLLGKKITKIKAQTNYSLDMKTCMLADLSYLYECKLKEYCRNNSISITPEKIASDVKYYKLIVIAMNDACEDITIDRYIHNNDLYRYKNKNDWEVFKQNVKDLYYRESKQVIIFYYDNNKIIMPIHKWIEYAVIELKAIIEKNTDKLLEDLKTESLIYYNSMIENGISEN